MEDIHDFSGILIDAVGTEYRVPYHLSEAFTGTNQNDDWQDSPEAFKMGGY